MNRTLVIEPEAEAEIAQALDWYSERSTSARIGFQVALDRALSLVRHNPLQYQRVYRDVRRALVGHYPYALIYTASEAEIRIVACFHGRRDPKPWRSRVHE